MSFGFLDIFFALFLVAFLFCTRPVSGEDSGFDRDTTASLRGIAMLMIMIHHVHSRFNGNSPILDPGGYLCVGLFFLISGYGNTLSLNKRKELKTDWLVNKLIKLYIPFFVAYWIYYAFLKVLYVERVPSGKEIISDLLTMSLPNKDTWFVKIILLCFLIHWGAKKIFSDVQKQQIFITVLILIYIIAARKILVKPQWYTTVACYPLGCIIACPRALDKLLKFLREKKAFSFVAFSILTVIALIAARKVWLVTMVCPIFFSMACYYYSFNFKTKTNFFSWIGTNSLEFYIFHYIFLQGLEIIFETNRYVYALGVVLCTMVTVYLYLFGKGMIEKIIEKVDR